MWEDTALLYGHTVFIVGECATASSMKSMGYIFPVVTNFDYALPYAIPVSGSQNVHGRR